MGDLRGCLPAWYSESDAADSKFVCPGCYQSKRITPPVVTFVLRYLRNLAYLHCLVFDTPSIRCIEPCRDEYITFNNIHCVLWRRASLADTCCHAGRTGTWIFSWQGISNMTLFMSTFSIMAFVAGEPSSYCFTPISRYLTIYYGSCQKRAIDHWIFAFCAAKPVCLVTSDTFWSLRRLSSFFRRQINRPFWGEHLNSFGSFLLHLTVCIAVEAYPGASAPSRASKQCFIFKLLRILRG